MSKDDPRSSVIRPRAGLIAIVGFCIGLPVLSAWAKGSIAIPHNDDWAYFRIVFHLADTGTLQLVGWNEAMFLGQLVWAIPLAKVFGDTFFAINTVSALISAGGLVLTYLLASRFLRTSYALLTAFLVGIFPGFIPLATTFMTDTTGYTAQLGCLVLGVWALDRRSDQRLLPLIACLVVGLYAFTVRDFAITTPVAVLAGLAVAEKRHRRVPALSIAGLAAVSAAGVALYLWRHSFPGDTSHYFGLQVGGKLFVYMAQSFFTLSLALLPALLFVATSNGWGIRRLITAASLIPLPWALLALLRSGGGATCCLGGSGSVFVGNLLTERGVTGNQVLAGARPTLFPAPIWWILSAGAVVGGCLIAGRLHTAFFKARTGPPLEPPLVMLATFGALNGAALVFRAVLGGPTFDRYLTPLVLVGSIFLLRGVSEPKWTRNRGAVVVTGLLGLASLAVVSSGHAFDAARWEAAEMAVAAGVPAESVDGGFEWVGSHYQGLADRDAPDRPDDFGPGYLNLFADAGNCAVVTASPMTDQRLELIGSVLYRTLFGLRSNELWLYRFGEGCLREA